MAKSPGRVLIVDDNLGVRRTLQLILPQHFAEVKAIAGPSELKSAISEFKPDVVLLDMNFKAMINTGNEGLFYLNEIKTGFPQIEVVLFTAYGDIPLAVEGMKKGAFDFIEKPWDNDNLIETLKKAYNKSHSKSSNSNSAEEIFWGSSAQIEEIRKLISKISPTDISVLIQGENGVGKDLLAKEIHNNSSRKGRPYVAVDMGAVTDSLFESELFGHAKGSFTGAVSDHKGKFEQAEGGTLFLDEIGNLPLHLQAKLLRALQNRVITKVGGDKEIPVDIRIICATNKDLKKEVEAGRFREDLFYRLSGFVVELPALRERKEDILPLARHFLDLYSRKYNKDVSSFDEGSKKFLLNNVWSGNIRELKQQIEKAVIFSENDMISLDNILAGTPETTFSDRTADEKTLISEALNKTGRNISATAKLLNMSRPTLYAKINKYNL